MKYFGTFSELKTVSVSTLLLLLLSVGVSGCAEDGQSPNCAMGGRGALEEANCLTPIGGSCLTMEEFIYGRPTDGPITPTEEWQEYKKLRPQCDFAPEE